MALAAHALTTIETLEAVLHIESTSSTYAQQIARLELLTNSVSDAMRQLAGRDFHRVVDRTEDVRHPGGPYLFLRHAPIVDVTSVSEISIDELTLLAFVSTDYKIEAELGALSAGDWASTAPLDGIARRPRSGFELPLYRVVYSSGWITPWQADDDYEPDGPLGTRDLPWDLEEACVRAVEANWYRSGAYLDSASRGDQTASFRNRFIGLLPEDVADLCRSYQRSL